jgi:hypothetical protein
VNKNPVSRVCIEEIQRPRGGSDWKHKYPSIQSCPITRDRKSQMWPNAEEWKPMENQFYRQIDIKINYVDNQFDNGRTLNKSDGFWESTPFTSENFLQNSLSKEDVSYDINFGSREILRFWYEISERASAEQRTKYYTLCLCECDNL